MNSLDILKLQILATPTKSQSWLPPSLAHPSMKPVISSLSPSLISWRCAQCSTVPNAVCRGLKWLFLIVLRETSLATLRAYYSFLVRYKKRGKSTWRSYWRDGYIASGGFSTLPASLPTPNNVIMGSVRRNGTPLPCASWIPETNSLLFQDSSAFFFFAYYVSF
jgi:hypothetical protein